MFATISPRDNLTGILDDDGFIRIVGDAASKKSKISAERFLTHHPDTIVIPVQSETHAIEEGNRRRSMSMALDMFLLLFDSEVSVKTRRELAGALNRLFQDDLIKLYVLDIVLSEPLAKQADIDGAKESAEQDKLVEELVSSVIECQSRVSKIFNSWIAIRQDAMVRSFGVDQTYGLFSLHGIFRRLALEATDRDELDNLSPSLIIDPELKSKFDAAPRILKLLLQEIRKCFPDGGKARSAKRLSKFELLDDHPDQRSIRSHESKLKKPHAAFTSSLVQVSEIARLYGQENDLLADEYLEELKSDQVRYQKGEAYVVKSLCNIATKVNGYGRPEIALKCLMDALDYEKGIDSQLFLQMGHEFRTLGKLDNAIECLKKAESLDDGTLFDRILTAKIKISSSKGDYGAAISEYLKVPQLEFNPLFLAALGTLYRKVGRLRDAKKTYKKSILIDPDSHLPQVGIAETFKQTGRPHQAIAAYNKVFRQFDHLSLDSEDDSEISAKKIYNLARSNLLRMTRQYDKAEKILNNLSMLFPRDRSVNLEFAKYWTLRGRDEAAVIYFDKAQQTPDVFNLSELIFIKASKHFSLADNKRRSNESESPTDPTENSLVTCLRAFDLIRESAHSEVQPLLEQTKFVDRSIRDFSDVLRFHAKRKLDVGFSYKQDHAMCHVAKRSDKSLRDAMFAIDQNDFVSADRLERHFMLRVAF